MSLTSDALSVRPYSQNSQISNWTSRENDRHCGMDVCACSKVSKNLLHSRQLPDASSFVVKAKNNTQYRKESSDPLSKILSKLGRLTWRKLGGRRLFVPSLFILCGASSFSKIPQWRVRQFRRITFKISVTPFY